MKSLGVSVMCLLMAIAGCKGKTDKDLARREKLISWLADLRASGDTPEVRAFNERVIAASRSLAQNKPQKNPVLLGCVFSFYPSPTAEGRIGNVTVVWIDGPKRIDRLNLVCGEKQITVPLSGVELWAAEPVSAYGLMRSPNGDFWFNDVDLAIPAKLPLSEVKAVIVDIDGNKSEPVGMLRYAGKPGDTVFAWAVRGAEKGSPAISESRPWDR